MIPAVVPDDIKELHRALLAALRVDYFPPGMLEMNAWRDFLFVMKPLEESVGGPFEARDIAATVTLMRRQNQTKEASWALRFTKIMRDPEAFRDLVLMARKVNRPRAPIETTSRTDATGAEIMIERDPAAEAEPTEAGKTAAAQLRGFRERMRNGGGAS